MQTDDIEFEKVAKTFSWIQQRMGHMVTPAISTTKIV